VAAAPVNVNNSRKNPGQTIWKIDNPDHASAAGLSLPDGVSPIAGAILKKRGLATATEMADFLSPRLALLNNPFLFKDMDKAAARVADAVMARESLCVYGDYDADGMTSTAHLKLFFHDLGLDVRTFLPDREADGYGLHQARIEEIAASGVTLIICVDCGIKSVEAAVCARNLGVDLVILDHHLPGDTLPDVCAVVDPHRADCPFPFKDLAAVGISFYFCGALRRVLADRGRTDLPDVRDYLDLVAIGTVADVMPLVRDNRILVKAGLERINQRARPGVAALKSIAGCRPPVTSGAISFRIAPRLNASGRMANPGDSLNLLVSPDDRTAATWAERLELANSQRREVESLVTEEARARVIEAGGPDARAIVVAGSGWHPGVLGIVASRLVDEFRLPSIVMTIDDGIATGSGRSIEGFDLGAALASLESMLIRTGGHPMAAGLSLEMSRFDEFVAAFKRIADLMVGDVAFQRTLPVDVVLEIQDLTQALADEISAMEPFGMGNPEPTLAMSGVTVCAARKVGREADHLKLQFESGGRTVDGIWFNAGSCGLEEGAVVDVAFHLTRDSMTGGPSLKIRDIRPADID